MWCGSFAGLHLFWALGGSVGLASSAGRDLAVRRPTSFDIFGLYGTALLLVVGILIIAVTRDLERPGACAAGRPYSWPLSVSDSCYEV